MDTKVLNREWVKTAAIIFLAVLLVLTFFSNTILNRSLPEAATVSVNSGSIVTKVRGSGTVEAKAAHDVKLSQTREIRTVMVKVGDEVKVGDTLFVLGAGDSKELESARDALRDLQYSYQRAALTMPNFDYSTLNRNLDSADRALQLADKEYSNALELYNKMESKLLADPDTSDSMQQLQDAEATMELAYEGYILAQTDYDAKYIELSAEVSLWQQRVNELIEIQESADPETGETGGEESLSLMSVSGSAPDPSTVTDLATAQSWLAAAQSTLEGFISSNKQTLNSAYEVYQTAKTKYDALKKYNDTLFYELVPFRESLDQAESKRYEAQLAYEAAIHALDFQMSNNEQDYELAALELQQIAEKIAIQQEKVKQLSGEAEDQVLANVGGIVRSISCKPGDTVTADSVLCSIELPDMGYSLSFSVTNEQARRLRVGDTATVSNYYWGNEIIATLSKISIDPKNPQSSKLLSFDLQGDVSADTELTLSVGSKSATYDLLVPNSAIKTDSNGSFVLLVQSKSSPLGNRYTAKRVSVEVLASDDSNSAVVAELNAGDFVVATSSAPLKNGDQLRLAEG